MQHHTTPPTTRPTFPAEDEVYNYFSESDSDERNVGNQGQGRVSPHSDMSSSDEKQQPHGPSTSIPQRPSNDTGESVWFMLLLCAPRMATSMAWSAQWAAFGPLLSTIFGAPWKVQLIQIIGPITGLLVVPAIGVLSDHNNSAYGRRRGYLLGGAVATLLCWSLMMNAQSIGRALGDSLTDQPITAVFIVVCYLWMDISVNVIQTSANLIIADFSGYRQVTGFAIASSYGVAGSMFVSGYIWMFGPAHQSTHWFFLMLIGVVLVTVFPVCAFVREVPLALLPRDRSSSMMWQHGLGGQKVLRFKDAALGFYRGVRYLPRQLAVFCVVVVCVTYGFNAYNGAKSVYWGEYVFNGTSTNANTCDPNCSPAQARFNDGAKLAGGPVDTAFNIVSLIYLAVLPSLVGRFGARRVLLWSTTPQILLVIMTFSRIVVLDVIVITLCAVSQSTITALQIPAVMHVIGYGEQEGLGLYAGAFNSAICVGQLMNFALSSALVSTSMGPALPILVGGILSLFAFLIVRKHFTLRMKTY